MPNIIAKSSLFAAAVLVLFPSVAWSGGPSSDLIGAPQTYLTKQEDTLLDVARNYDIGYVELIIANERIDPWLPGAGVTVTIPSQHILPSGPHRGIVINLAEMRLYYFPSGGGAAMTFPIGIGGEENQSKVGTTQVVSKRPNPTWVPPPSIRAERPELPAAIPPGPDNPLGAFALYLGWPRYVVHGTNKPYGVGRRVSHGCIRLYPEDIARLYPLVPVGTPVRVMNDPVKFGWSDGVLYIEVHLDQQQADEIEERGDFTPHLIEDLGQRAIQAAGSQAYRLDWTAITIAGFRRTGMPTRIMN